MRKLERFNSYFYKNFPYIKEIEKLIPDDAELDSWHEQKLVENLTAVYEEATELKLSERIVKMLILIEAKNICPELKVSYNQLTFYIFDIFDALKDNRAFLGNSEYETKFLSAFHYLCPLLVTMEKNIDDKKFWNALNMAKRIYEFLLNECITKEMKEEEVIAELKKEYAIPEAYIHEYRYRMKRRKYPDFYLYGIGKSSDIKTYSRISNLLISYFSIWIYVLYNKHNCYYTPLNDDFDFYVLNGIKIITYKYDDDINMNFHIAGRTWEMNNYRLWGFVANSETYILENNLKVKYPNLLSSDVDILCPEDSILKALKIYLKQSALEEEIIEKVSSSLGMMPDLNTDDILRLSKMPWVYIRNPKEFEKLKIKNIDDFPTLKKILSLSGKQREQYLKRLVAKAKGDFMRDFKNDVRPYKEEHRRTYID